MVVTRSLAARIGIAKSVPRIILSAPMSFVITQGANSADTGWLYVGFPIKEEGAPELLPVDPSNPGMALNPMINRGRMARYSSMRELPGISLKDATWGTVGQTIRANQARVEKAINEGMKPSEVGEDLYKDRLGNFDKASNFRRVVARRTRVDGVSTDFEFTQIIGSHPIRIGLEHPGDFDQVSRWFATVLGRRFVG